MIKHKINYTWTNNAGSISRAYENEFATELNGDVTVNDGVVDQAQAIAFDVADARSVFIISNVDVTIETNDGTTPDDTLALKAGAPYVWQYGVDYADLAFVNDVESWYLTNSTGQQARLQYRILTV